MKSMKLSIITINYNNAEGLRKTLASVAAQTYRDIEHIIIDGGSTDGSVDVIKEYEEQLHLTHSTIHIQWTSEPDKGIYDGMNRGIRKATGDYIQILNSGDILATPDVTERMFAALKKYQTSNIKPQTSVPILYGNMLKAYPNGKIVRDNCGGQGAPESFLYFYTGTLNHDCAYIRRDLFEKYGLYNEQMKICSDWEWYIRAIVLGGEKPVYTNIDVTIFDTNGISESNLELRKAERRQVLEKVLPPVVLADYNAHAFEMEQMKRLRKHHLYWFVYFVERVLFKLEKWGILHGQDNV